MISRTIFGCYAVRLFASITVILLFVSSGCDCGSSNDDAAGDDSDDRDDDEGLGPISRKCDDPQPSGLAPMPSNKAGIFISVETGSDENPGTMEKPVKSIRQGLELALVAENLVVFVAEGEYSENIPDDESIHIRRSIFGGYEPQCWQRHLERRDTHLRDGSRLQVALFRGDPSRVTVEGFTIHTGGFGFDLNSPATMMGNTILGCEGPETVESCLAVSDNAEDSILMNNIIVGSVDTPTEEITLIFASPSIFQYYNNYLIASMIPFIGAVRGINAVDAWSSSTNNNVFDFRNVIDGDSISVDLAYHIQDFDIDQNDFWGLIDCMVRVGSACLHLDGDHDMEAYDYNIVDAGNIAVDPMVTDFDGFELYPQSGSPLIDAGVNLDFSDSNYDVDFEGLSRPFGTAWDIGPYEWRPW